MCLPEGTLGSTIVLLCNDGLLYKRKRVFIFRLCFQLKEMCRRELDKSESEIKKNGSIIGEYKQVNTHTHTVCVSSEHDLQFLFEIALI